MKGIFIILFCFSIIQNIYGQNISASEICNELNEDFLMGYLSQNSCLIQKSPHELIHFYSRQGKLEKNSIKTDNLITTISNSKNDKYLVMLSVGESRAKGLLIDGLKQRTIEGFRTTYTKISDDGKYILTTKHNDFFDGGFKVIDSDTFEDLAEIQGTTNIFYADFLDNDRIFVIFRPFDFRRSGSRRFSSRQIEKEKVENGAEYIIYNLQTRQIEDRNYLTYDGNKYNISTFHNSLAIAKDGQNILIACYNAQSDDQDNNTLLNYNFHTKILTDVTSDFTSNVTVNGQIIDLRFIDNKEFLLIYWENKRYTIISGKIDEKENIVLNRMNINKYNRGIIESVIKENGKLMVITNGNKIFEYDNKNEGKWEEVSQRDILYFRYNNTLLKCSK